jgi:hypothetical protein
MTGLLNNLDELLAKAKHCPSVAPETPEERQASIARLDTVLAEAAQREFDRDIEEILAPRLEEKYEQQLADLYDAEIAALQRKTPRVRQEYASLFKRCRALCREAGVFDYPVSPLAVAAWLHEEAQDGASYTTLKKCHAAASYFHKINGLPDPTEALLPRAVLRAHVGARGPGKKRNPINAKAANGQAH